MNAYTTHLLRAAWIGTGPNESLWVTFHYQGTQYIGTVTSIGSTLGVSVGGVAFEDITADQVTRADVRHGAERPADITEGAQV